MSFFVKGADYISELGLRNLHLARALDKNRILFERLVENEGLMKIADNLPPLADGALTWVKTG